MVVAVSPIALDLFGGSANSWARRGNIGQTYGAAAALLSVVALGGVAVSLALQARESKANREHASRLIHTDLILSYWESRWELGQLSEIHLREAAAHMFQAAPGRGFWADARTLRTRTSESRRAQRFHRILDEEYLKALTPGPSPAADTP